MVYLPLSMLGMWVDLTLKLSWVSEPHLLLMGKENLSSWKCYCRIILLTLAIHLLKTSRMEMGGIAQNTQLGLKQHWKTLGKNISAMIWNIKGREDPFLSWASSMTSGRMPNLLSLVSLALTLMLMVLMSSSIFLTVRSLPKPWHT